VSEGMADRHISGSQLRTRKFVFSKTPADELRAWCNEFDDWVKQVKQDHMDERMKLAMDAAARAALAAAAAEARELAEATAA
jgi:hypothetical protein